MKTKHIVSGIVAVVLLGCKQELTPRDAGIYQIATAQAAFRALETDNKVTGASGKYWRSDIAGLYAAPGHAGKPIELIPLELALADDRPKSDLSRFGPRAPFHGYWFRSIQNEDEKGIEDAHRFAACCFPARYTPGALTYLVNENGTVFKKDLGREGGVEVFPTDPASLGWKNRKDD